ncbi:IclR family transcriptional regulator [Sciscionella marina]|uniref:IclR family transcriptional regulator n=1 Tax=Sciscionella marina TaxID=508770 RepID=UPI001F08E0A2|nr:IclR family transcriptional regulator [Sciscionella marina]
MTLIMNCFYGKAVRHSIEDVARATQLPRSTTHRILVDLVRLGWLTQTPAGYGIGSRALSFGSDGGYGGLRKATAPLLHDLAMRTGMVAHLGVLVDAEIYYLDKVGGRFATKVPSQVGGRAPAHCTALGKSMLACLPPEQVDRQLAGGLGRHTERTICRLDTLHHELGRIRGRNGMAFERGECSPAVACVAVAIRSADGPVGSISLCGEAGTPLERIAPLVVQAAREATHDLFGPARKNTAGRKHPPELGPTWSVEAMNALLAIGSGQDWI